MRRRLFPVVFASVAVSAFVVGSAQAQQSQVIAPIRVEAESTPGDRPASAASETTVFPSDTNARPVTRPAEALEAVPGLIVTQHSGEGKANQYFLRGFNLDHGTDFAAHLDGMPLNMRTHGHGQGYLDLNFLIPELLGPVTVRKGPYYADEGDFSSAGSVRFNYVDKLDKNLIEASFGSFGHRRLLGAASKSVGAGTLLTAGEIVMYNGPWTQPDDLRKFNGFLRYSQGTDDNGLSLTIMAYSNTWTATDQVPARAVDSGLISPYGTLDPTDGGLSSRYSVSGRWSRRDDDSATRVEAYAVRSSLQLFNNFTFFQDNPTDGDQFKQTDNRIILGANAKHTLFHDLMGRRAETSFGFQSRYDDIEVALQRTQNRAILSTVRDDLVRQGSIGLFGETKIIWTDWLRTTLGLRGDWYTASVISDTPENSGKADAALLSPKGGVVFGPFARTELFVNAGQGFHSNDARGATTRLDPNDRTTTLAAVPLLVKSTGFEIGLRSRPFDGLQTTLALFSLQFDSENLFVGDAGTTVASRPSRRLGLEWTGNYKPVRWLAFDGSVAITDAKFTNDDPAGQEVPGAPTMIAAAGITYGDGDGWFGGARLRYFGARPLIEDNSARSDPTLLVNARLGYRFSNKMSVRLDVLNLLDSNAKQIDYFYTSRLPGEALGGIADRHFHPVEPRAFRLTMTGQF